MSSSYSTGLPLFAGKLEGVCTEGQMLTPSAVSTMAFDEVQGRFGYLKAKIGGFDCYVLVDTGTSCSVIAKHLWISITKGGCELVDYRGQATAANGGGMHVVGCWQTACQFDSLVLVIQFLVSNIPSSDVLLAQYGAVVDFGKKYCQIMGKQFPLADLSPSREPQIVVIQADTVIPPRSEAIIQGQVQSGWGDYAEGMLEPFSSISKHCDILVA